MFDLKLGFSCNNNCVHCVVEDKRNILSKDLTFEEIKNIEKTKIRTLTPKPDGVVLTGGEPTIRKDFVSIVKYFSENGYEVHLQTNGTGLADENIIKEIKPYMTQVLIAIHSMDENVHNNVVRDKKGIMFKKTYQALLNLIKHQIPFETQTVLSKYNIDTLYDTYKKIQELKPKVWMHMTYPHPLGNAYSKDVALKYSAIKNEIQRCFKDFGPYLVTEAIPLCYIYPYEKTIGYNSDLEIASQIYEIPRIGLDPSNKNNGNNKLIDKDGLSYNYNINDLTSKLKGKKCGECDFNDICPGVWKEYFDFYKKELDLYPIKIKNTIKKDSYAIALFGGECLNRCVFCNGGLVSKISTFSDIKEDIDANVIKNNIHTVDLTGEPLSHPMFLDTILYLSENNVNYIQISTHGRLFKDKKLAENAKIAGATHVDIPLYGINDTQHNAIARNKYDSQGSPFLEACEGIRNCSDSGLIVCGHTLITQYNKNDLLNILKLYINLSNGNMKEFVIRPVGISYISKDFTGEWYLPLKDIYEQNILYNFIKEIEKYTFSFNIRILEIPYCVAKSNNINIISNKGFVPNINVTSILSNNNSLLNTNIPHYRETIRTDVCDGCIMQVECAGWNKNDYAMFGTGNVKPIKEKLNV